MGMGMGMGWYKRLIFDRFRRLNWKKSIHCATVRQSRSVYSSIISQPIFRTNSNVLKNLNFNNRIKNPNFPKFQSRNHVLKNHNSNQIKNPNLVEFKAMRCRRRRRWYWNPWKLGGLVGFGVMVYYRNSETVPYSKRRQFVMMSISREKKMSESSLLEVYKSTFEKGTILGPDHPDSIRVQKVGRKILEGLRRGFCNRLEDDEDRDRVIAMLDEYNWEFLVADEPTINNASYFLGGKIVIYSGSLKHSENDVDIACTLSHEVAHVVARHYVEWLSKIFMWPLFWFQSPEDHSYDFIWHPINRRLELEADYIGFLISASAGYDPWKMLESYKKSYIDDSSSSGDDQEVVSSSSHPNGKTRVEQVSQARVMEQALTLYEEAIKDKDSHEKKAISIFQKISNFILSDKKYSSRSNIFTDLNNRFMSRCRCRCSASPRSHPFI